MSGYFRDRYQGVGAIAAAAPAPRSAPAPTFGRLARTNRGGVCMPGCFPLEDGSCDCPLVVGNASRVRRGGSRASMITPIARRSLGASRVDGEDVGAAGGGTTTGKSLLRQFLPGVLAPPVRTTSPTKQPILSQPVTMVATAVTSPGYLPPRIPAKSQTASASSGGAAWAGGGGGTTLNTMAPPDTGPELEMPGASASPGGLPGGAAKLWVALGLGAAAFFTYRHFKKRRRR